MRINPWVYGVVVVVVFLGVVGAAQAAGLWSVSGKLTPSGKPVTLSGANPDEIKGWMTLGSIAEAYGLDYDALLAQFELPAETPRETPIKELESETFSPDALRTWLRERPAP